jgi:hypothetical protein
MLIPERPGYRQDMADLVDATVVAFLDLYLGGKTNRLDSQAEAVAASGLATLQSRT